MRSFEEIAAEFSDLIELALDHFLCFGSGCPPKLAEAIRYATLGAGKRFRPILVLSAARACGGKIRLALPAACAVEMVHTYSLIHDDLPAMDNDDFRRGRPTCHRVFGEGLAILAGDALLARAFEVLATEISPPELAARCCATLARAAGPEELVGGQADDLTATGSLRRQSAGESCQWPPHVSGQSSFNQHQVQEDSADGGSTAELVRAIHRRKTASMMWASARLGGLVAEASAAFLAALETYGRKLGLAFQIVDDLLDAAGDPQKVGKKLRKDHDQGKLTYPAVFGVAASRQEATQLIEEACEAVSILGAGAGDLLSLAYFVLQRQK